MASAVASPLGQLESEECVAVIRTLREHLPAAEFEAALAALAGGLDEVAAQTLTGRRAPCRIAPRRCSWTPSTTCWSPWW